MDAYRVLVLRHASRLYSPEEAERKFGRVVTAPEAIEEIMGDIRMGRLELRNTSKVCSQWGCTDLKSFLRDVDGYYRASGARAREEYRLKRELLKLK